MSNPKGNEATLKKFKPKWYNGTTQTIRVPITLADQILEYAHKLDESPSQVNEVSNGSHFDATASQRNNLDETLTQVIELLELISMTDRFTKRWRERLKVEAIAPLKALTQVNNEPLEILEAIDKLESERENQTLDTVK